MPSSAKLQPKESRTAESASWKLVATKHADSAVRAPGASRAACFLRRGAGWQLARLMGLRPPLAPAPAFREGVNVLLARSEEI